MTRVAIFGAPGSGKSTTAKIIGQKLKASTIEGGSEVIQPLYFYKNSLPPESGVISAIKNAHKIKKPIDRIEARRFYKQLADTYSADFVSRTIHEIYVNESNTKNIIFVMRGYENAVYSKLHNDVVVYLKTDQATSARRLSREKNISFSDAMNDLKGEEKLYRTSSVEKIADLVIDTRKHSSKMVSKIILDFITEKEKVCKKCVNSQKNPAIKIESNGLCRVCNMYAQGLNKEKLKQELATLKSFKDKNKKYDIMVGVSGGKDSTATLHTIKSFGFTPLAFTFDLGYLPKTTVPRSRAMAKLLDCKYEHIDIRKYIRGIDRKSYEKSAALYELPFTLTTKKRFLKEYEEGRKHYSVKCKHSPVFVRSCQLCRRMVVRAYYHEAAARGIGAIALGINEWTNLAAAQGGKFVVSGIRKLQPYKNKPAVYIFHVPFILQRTSKQTRKILDQIGWTAPKGEDFIESNSNSCLYARSMERDAKRHLGFHPDASRLGREVTVGFITKKEALKALGKIHPYKDTPRDVLKKAKIL